MANVYLIRVTRVLKGTRFRKQLGKYENSRTKQKGQSDNQKKKKTQKQKPEAVKGVIGAAPRPGKKKPTERHQLRSAGTGIIRQNQKFQ